MKTEPIADDQLVAALGAMLFASDEPVRPRQIARALGGLETDKVKEALADLERRYEQADVGIRLEWIAGGARLATLAAVGGYVRQYFRDRNRTRLSPAALETLAIIAYRQPVTAPEIQAIRGKDPSPVLKGILEKRLVKVLGRKKVVGNPLLYGTTKHFLEHFGLNGLGELPSMEEFDELVGVLEERQASAALEDLDEESEVPAEIPAEAPSEPEPEAEPSGPAG